MNSERPPEPLYRFIVPSARERLEAMFSFAPDPYMQDWDIERADSERLPNFVQAYKTADLTDDDRFALMALIVASAHESFDGGLLTDATWAEISDLLVSDVSIHASTIYDWCCPDAQHADEFHTITPQMRMIWNAAFPESTSMPPVQNCG